MTSRQTADRGIDVQVAADHWRLTCTNALYISDFSMFELFKKEDTCIGILIMVVIGILI